MTELIEVDSSKTQTENVTNADAKDPNETTTENENPFKTNKKPPKRKKLKKLTETDGGELQANENDGDNFNGMPTPPPSKRQKKRQKKMQIVTRTKDKEMEKTIAYLTKWDTERDEWKYEKLRQIFIQKHIFDETVIPSEHIDVAIKYLSTSKGHARKLIVEAAESIIKEIDDKITDENQEELTSCARYERAREILQTMQE